MVKKYIIISFVLVCLSSTFCLLLEVCYRGFLMGLQNDKEFHTKGLAASEIDLHALLSEYEKSKLITKVVISQQQVNHVLVNH